MLYNKDKKYLDVAKQALKTEIQGLNSVLEKSIDDTFVQVVKTIMKTKGKVIVSGMGKSGYIAHKAAATFASTGTPSFFIHPGEASHGDLGMISKDDIVILISASGGSKELNDIIAYCKRYGIQIIGITQKLNSTLGESADIKVILEKLPENNPVNSPTTSMLMTLAYFDTLAATLIYAKGFNNDKYKAFHPGGKLGAALIKVAEIMSKDDLIPVVKENDSMEIVLNTMTDKRLSCTGVLNKDNNLIGIITDGDIKRKLLEHSDLLKKKAKDIMTLDPIKIEKDAYALEAINLMANTQRGGNNIQVLFVTDSEQETNKEISNVVGLLHIQDCLKAGVM